MNIQIKQWILPLQLFCPFQIINLIIDFDSVFNLSDPRIISAISRLINNACILKSFPSIYKLPQWFWVTSYSFFPLTSTILIYWKFYKNVPSYAVSIKILIFYSFICPEIYIEFLSSDISFLIQYYFRYRSVLLNEHIYTYWPSEGDSLKTLFITLSNSRLHIWLHFLVVNSPKWSHASAFHNTSTYWTSCTVSGTLSIFFSSFCNVFWVLSPGKIDF